MKANLLRGKIVEQGMNVGEFCVKANFVRSTFDRKLNGETEFTRDEIDRIISILGLSEQETCNIFFTRAVAE